MIISFCVIKCALGYLKITYTANWEQKINYVNDKAAASKFSKKSASVIVKKFNLQVMEFEEITVDRTKPTVIEVGGKLIDID